MFSRCGELDHIARDCPTVKRDVTCYNCNESGELTYSDCPTVKRDVTCYNCNESGRFTYSVCPTVKHDVTCYNCNESGQFTYSVCLTVKRDVTCYNCNESGRFTYSVCFCCPVREKAMHPSVSQSFGGSVHHEILMLAITSGWPVSLLFLLFPTFWSRALLFPTF